MVKARTLAGAGVRGEPREYADRLAIVREPGYRAARINEAQEGAALAKMPNPQAFIKTIEQSIDAEEASLVKELSPPQEPARAWRMRSVP